MRPPAPRIAATPSVGLGVPCAICTSPSTPMIRAVQPMIMRAVSAFRSGCRRYLQASRPSRSGTTHAADPNPLRTTAESPWPTAPPRRNQVTAAMMIARPRAARPAPSLRCAGSRSRACRPKARTVAPTVCARAIHTPPTAATAQPIRIAIGLLDGALLPRPPPVLPRYAALDLPRERRGGVRADPPLGRFPVPVERDRVVVAPFERVVAFLGRAVPLGARVAMIPTVPTDWRRAKHQNGVSPAHRNGATVWWDPRCCSRPVVGPTTLLETCGSRILDGRRRNDIPSEAEQTGGRRRAHRGRGRRARRAVLRRPGQAAGPAQRDHRLGAQRG